VSGSPGTLIHRPDARQTEPRRGGLEVRRSGPVRLWDNANIVESFPGITLPLTFSVAREAYATVYRGACRALGVAEATIRENDDLFDQLLGHIDGRVYYNVTNWHRLVALLPAFRANQGHLERMMGAERPGGGPGERAGSVRSRPMGPVAGARILVRAFVALVTFERRARSFLEVEERLLGAERQTDIRGQAPDDLLDRYERLRRLALVSWQPPIINDVFVMVFHGALRTAVQRWCTPEATQAVNRLLRSREHPGSSAAASLRSIGAAVRSDPAWRAALEAGDQEAVAARIARDPQLAGLRELMDRYLDGWGGRAPGALHLDRPSLVEDPGLVLAAVRDLATSPQGLSTADGSADREAHARLMRSVGGSPVVRAMRRAVLGVLIRRARYHLTWRERMRLVRMDVFAAGRRIFEELGRAWVTQGVLDSAGDLHYLDLQEIRALIRATGPVDDVRGLVRRRRAEEDRHRADDPPPSRFETIGTVALQRPATVKLDGSAAPTTDKSEVRDGVELMGIGVSFGRVRGPCLLVTEPRAVTTVRGHIVVAQSTDPGWLPLMLSARGLLVEQGSLLSHSAIVARELGLPAVVGIPGLMTRLRSGWEVELDGGTGRVRILTRAAEAGDG
jgi:phosphohistidine swiveling domain-containing protein